MIIDDYLLEKLAEDYLRLKKLVPYYYGEMTFEEFLQRKLQEMGINYNG